MGRKLEKTRQTHFVDYRKWPEVKHLKYQNRQNMGSVIAIYNTNPNLVGKTCFWLFVHFSISKQFKCEKCYYARYTHITHHTYLKPNVLNLYPTKSYFHVNIFCYNLHTYYMQTVEAKLCPFLFMDIKGLNFVSAVCIVCTTGLHAKTFLTTTEK